MFWAHGKKLTSQGLFFFALNGTSQPPTGRNWLITPLSLRGGCVSCYAGKKIPLQKTGPCGRTSPWSEGSSVFLSQNVTPYMNRRATRCITMATGRPTLSMFQQSRFRFVYLGQFNIALSKQSFTLSREISVSLLPASLNIGFSEREQYTAILLRGVKGKLTHFFQHVYCVPLPLSPHPQSGRDPHLTCLVCHTLWQVCFVRVGWFCV